MSIITHVASFVLVGCFVCLTVSFLNAVSDYQDPYLMCYEEGE